MDKNGNSFKNKKDNGSAKNVRETDVKRMDESDKNSKGGMQNSNSPKNCK